MKRIAIILIICIYIVLGKEFNKSNTNNANENYEIITYDRFITMQNDGGSHYDTRYIIDLDNKQVKKLADYYKGFSGYVYKDKVLYEKKLSDDETNELKKIIDDIIDNKDAYSIDKDNTYEYYTLNSDVLDEIKIYDRDVIKNLEDILSEKN